MISSTLTAFLDFSYTVLMVSVQVPRGFVVIIVFIAVTWALHELYTVYGLLFWIVL